MDALAAKLNITSLETWTQQAIPPGLLRKYGHSLCKVLSGVYPEYMTLCRALVVSVMQDRKLARVEDVLSLPLEYPLPSSMLMCSCVLPLVMGGYCGSTITLW